MIEVLKQAVDWAEKHGEVVFAGGGMKAIEPMNDWVQAGRQAIAKLESQEPVGQLLEDAFGRGQVMWFNKPKDESMLYTTPPKENKQ